MTTKILDTQCRKGTYYFRKRIPAELVGRAPFGEKQQFIQFSLYTKSPQVAAKALSAAYAKYENLIAAARGVSVPSQHIVRQQHAHRPVTPVNRPTLQQLGAAVDRFRHAYLAEYTNVRDARDHREYGELGVELIAGRPKEDWEQIVNELENAPLFPDRSIRIAGELLEKEGWDIDLEGADFEWLCDRLRSAELSACRTIINRSLSKEYMSSAELRRQEIDLRTQGYTIKDAVRDYIELNPSATEMHEKMNMAAEVWQDLMPVSRIAEIDVHHVIDFIDILRRMPKNAKQRFPGLPSSAAIAANDSRPVPFPTISATTIKDNYVGQINTAVGIALERKRASHNPFYGRRVSGSSKAVQDRRPFTFEELRRIFSHPVFMGSRSAEHRYKAGHLIIKDHYYWPPIIALYTGMRASEIGALEINHIQWLPIGQDTLPYFKNIPGTKSDSAIRSLPIHPQLVEIGLLSYASEIAASGQTRLFPNWHKPNKKKYSEARCIRNFNDIVVRGAAPNVTGPTFHCFRNTMLSELEDHGFSLLLMQKMMGHKTVTGGYFSPQIERYYHRFCDALKYAELNLPSLLKRPA